MSAIGKSGPGNEPPGGAPRSDLSDGNVIRPRSFTAPPPDPAEALYYEGMAAYQHRNWQQALDRFSRLKALQPSRPGLDALLDEVRWFLELHGASPSGGALPDTLSLRASQPPDRRHRLRQYGFAFVSVALIVVAAVALLTFRDRLWSRPPEPAEDLLEQGEARLNAGDYEGAQAAFRQVLQVDPSNADAESGLERAEKVQQLAQSYAAVEAAIASEDWNKAASELANVMAIDPSYADVRAKADFVTQQRRLASFYTEGSRLYDQGQWEEAIGEFEKVRQLDAGYRKDAVAEFLFVSYHNAASHLLSEGGAKAAVASKALGYYSQALAIHPHNRIASNSLELARLYYEALRARDDRSLEAFNLFESLLAVDPAYAGGEAARELYRLLVAQGQAALAQGDVGSAAVVFRRALQLGVADTSGAQKGLARALAATPTPSPTPTATATRPEPTLVPTAVPTITPTVRPTAVIPPTTRLSPPAAAPSPIACVAGFVRDVAGAVPLPGVMVRLADAVGSTVTQTSPSGDYRFSPPLPGDYQVAIVVPSGWQSVSPESQTITLSASPGCVTVDFWLQRSTSRPTPPR